MTNDERLEAARNEVIAVAKRVHDVRATCDCGDCLQCKVDNLIALEQELADPVRALVGRVRTMVKDNPKLFREEPALYAALEAAERHLAKESVR